MTDSGDLGIGHDPAEANGQLADLAATSREAAVAARDLGAALGHAFEAAAVKGKGLREVLLGLSQDLQRLLLREVVLGPLAQGVSGMVAGMAAGVFHRGGMVGAAATPTRPADPAWWAEAPRFHGGGIAGLMPDEVPIIARRGEEVLTRDDPRHRDNPAPAAAPPSRITINVTAADADSFRRAEGRIGAEIATALRRHLRRSG